MTKKEKQKAGENLIKELLAEKSYTPAELIDRAALVYTERFGDTSDNPNDVKGRIGSILDTMKKDEGSGLQFDGGVYALKVEKPVKAKRTAKKKTEAETTEKTEEKPVKKRVTKKKAETEAKTEEQEKEKTAPMPATPTLQPIAPVVPVTPDVAPEPIPKKRGRKAKSEKVEAVKTEEKPVEVKTETVGEAKPAAKAEEVKAAPAPEVEEKKPKVEEKTEVLSKERADVSPKGTVMDMSFLFGDIKPKKEENKQAEQPQKAKYEAVKAEIKTEAPKQVAETGKKDIQAVPAPAPVKKMEQAAPVQKADKPKETPKKPAQESRIVKATRGNNARPRVLTADEKLQEAFLNRLHRLGGEYFEYYSVYLLEKYSRRNGRRLEGLKINGGDHDGGIDGELELTDILGFRETIYIQAKNWDPDKGDEKLWVVGETLLQQFIGACVCRQAKQGKQNCRGIFITTSRFTPEAKRILDETGDNFVGYDGSDLYETAKECGFGVVKKNGEWILDEELLSGERAFFNML
ncbi:MAG: restriction endonuclease [Clostridia bacterium]|nr:restriction endonuclease [Clostridia bacterium]